MIKLKQTFYKKEFDSIINEFPKMLQVLNEKPKHLLSELFVAGNGLKTILKLLDLKQDFEGLYIFYKDNIPFYVGVSGGVINRIGQHVKGRDHFTSSLCYKIGAAKYLEEMNIKHSGGRKGLQFDEYGEPAKKALMDCFVSFIPVPNEVELYLFEVYVSMKLGTMHYNCFKTH